MKRVVFFSLLLCSTIYSTKNVFNTTYSLSPIQDEKSVTIIKLTLYHSSNPVLDYENEKEILVLTPDQALRLAITLDDISILQEALKKDADLTSNHLLELISFIEYNISNSMINRRIYKTLICLPVSIVALDKIVSVISSSNAKRKISPKVLSVIPYICSIGIGTSCWYLLSKLVSLVSIDIPEVLEYIIEFCDVYDSRDRQALHKLEVILKTVKYDSETYNKLKSLRSKIAQLDTKISHQ